MKWKNVGKAFGTGHSKCVLKVIISKWELFLMDSEINQTVLIHIKSSRWLVSYWPDATLPSFQISGYLNSVICKAPQSKVTLSQNSQIFYRTTPTLGKSLRKEWQSQSMRWTVQRWGGFTQQNHYRAHVPNTVPSWEYRTEQNRQNIFPCGAHTGKQTVNNSVNKIDRMSDGEVWCKKNQAKNGNKQSQGR